MARKPEFSRDEAIAFISGNPDVMKATKKPLDQLSTQELTRKARELKKAQSQGREYSNERARGHAGNVSGRAKPVKHISPTNTNQKQWQYLQEQFVVGDRDNPPDVQDFLRLIDKVDVARKKQGIPSTQFNVAVYGRLKKSAMCEDITLQELFNDGQLHRLYSRHTKDNGQVVSYADTNDLLGLLNELFGYKNPPRPGDCEGPGEGWVAVYSLSIKVRYYIPPVKS